MQKTPTPVFLAPGRYTSLQIGVSEETMYSSTNPRNTYNRNKKPVTSSEFPTVIGGPSQAIMKLANSLTYSDMVGPAK